MIKEVRQNIILFTAFACMAAANIYLAYFLKRDESIKLFITFGFLFSLLALIFKQQITKWQFLYLIAGGIILRGVWLFSFPQLSDDYARFVWDGRLINAGYNPFKYLPADIMKQGFPKNCIDPVLYNALNSQTYYTCYPPLLQLFFGIGAWIFPHSIYGDIIILKLFIFLGEAGSVLLLTRLFDIYKIERKKILLYALNPMVIAELTGNVHYEGVMIFFILACVLSLHHKQFVISVMLLTAGIITKLIPILFLPLFFFYFGWKKGLLFCLGAGLLFIAAWLPFYDISIIEKFWSSIDSYFQESEYNASIYYIIRNVVAYFTHENDIEIIGPALTVFSLLSVCVYAFVKRNKMMLRRLPAYMAWTLLIYYACTTTVFPWYITPVIALALFTPYTFPIVWGGVIVLSYYIDRNTLFEESDLILFIEYGTLAVSIIYDLIMEIKKRPPAIN